jgi:dienelactone hydrolase
MKSNAKIFFIIFFFILQSCSSKKDKDNNEEHFVKGKVIEKIICKKDTSQNYSLYLPSYYNSDKQWAVIYAFDSHARGNIPVKLLKDNAEKYGYIIVGSNNSKNGLSWEYLNNSIDILFDDTEQRFSVDKKRIYCIGFSGGARVATSIAIFKGGITGIIGCSAGFPKLNRPITNKFNYLGLTGNKDFNYLEMQNLNKALDKSDIKHQLIVFEGKHDWPPKKIIPDVFQWLEFNAMRNNLIPVNNSVIHNFIENNLPKKDETNNPSETYKTYILYKKLINYLDGLYDITEYEKILTKLEQSAQIQKALKYKEQNEQKEAELQQKYLYYLSAKNVLWWKKEVERLNGQIKNTKDKEKVLLIERLLNFLSLASYMQSYNAINSDNLEQAEKYLKLYKIIDTENYGPSYLYACLYSKQNKLDKAILELNNAINLGFDDFNDLKQEPMLKFLRNTKKYNETIKPKIN